MNELLAVGRITRAHGVGGEVAVQPLTEVEGRYARGSTLLLGPEGDRSLTVERSRPHQQRLLVKFEEVPDRTAAEALRGRLLLVSSDAAPEAPTGAFWVHQVVGLEVVTESGGSLGRITEVQSNPANDLWLTEAGALVPAVRDVVAEVDLEGGRVTIRDLPGLLEEPS